jgi:cytochrome c oxidase assembly protein Cox11
MQKSRGLVQERLGGCRRRETQQCRTRRYDRVGIEFGGVPLGDVFCKATEERGETCSRSVQLNTAHSDSL